MMEFWICFLGLAIVLSSVDCRPKVKRAAYPVPPPPRSQTSLPESRHEWAQAPVPDVQNEDVVNDPDVGEAGLTAIKDTSLDACFIYHYQQHFVLPQVQRTFYVENLPATFASSYVDKEDFLNSVGPLIGRECADKMCFWLDNGLFYQYMTKQLRPHGNGLRIRLQDHLPQLPSTTTFALPPPPPRRRRPFVNPPAPRLNPTTDATTPGFATPPPPPPPLKG